MRRMSNQPRVAKVLAVLLVSMTVGAVILMVLGNHPPQAGPFCLSSYYRLDPVEEALRSQAPQSVDRWERIEVYYSGTKAGNIEQLASLQGLARTEDINFHFCICNGRGGADGQIQTAEKWLRQWSAVPDKSWYGTAQTVRICVIADAENTMPTGFQIKRTESLVERLCRKFNVHPDYVYYPGNWR